MSKTFKALLRAAHERAGRKPHGHKRQGEPTGPPEIQRLHEQAGKDAAEESDQRPPTPRKPRLTPEPAGETLNVAPRLLPVGEPDPELQEILELELMVSANGGVLDEDGWLRGHLDRKLAKRLLERYGLLHVLMQNERNWFWFWASSTDARAMAERFELLLDFEERQAD